MNLYHALVHAATEYDRKEAAKAGQSIYARGSHFYIGHYLRRIEDVEIDIAQGATIRDALLAGFNGRLLDKLLKAAGEPKATKEEKKGRYVYRPASEGRKP